MRDADEDPAGADGDAGAGHAAPVTGHAEVDAALAGIVAVADADPGDQLPAYQQAHRVLQETLASLDDV